MAPRFIAVLLFAVVFQVWGQPPARSLWQEIREALSSLIASDILGKKTQPIVPDIVPFPCDVTFSRSEVRPETVDKVRPGDIDVVAAFGDGLTSAASAPNILTASEHKELSWSMGGAGSWRWYLTLPNILREFNPNLIGYSSSRMDPGFNVARKGTTSADAPNMALEVIKSMKDDPRVNLELDWKLVTIMIGTNDFCNHVCRMSGSEFNTSHNELRHHLTIALDSLRDNLPRTIVNLVLPPGTRSLLELNKRNAYCHMQHYTDCPCFFGPMVLHSLEENLAMQEKWLMVQEELARDSRYRRDDFAVIVQPSSRGSHVPLVRKDGACVPDDSYVTDDCFHFSQKAHASAANALWNNMLEPVSMKTTDWTPPFQRFLCPTETHPFIFTYDNEPTGNFTAYSHGLIPKEYRSNPESCAGQQEFEGDLSVQELH